MKTRTFLLVASVWASQFSALMAGEILLPERPPLPADVAMNKDAGRGNRLIVMLRFEDGPELPFVVDTGAAGTLIDKSLEPKLGKRLGTAMASHFGSKHKIGIYATPRLYLGGTPLMTGSNVAATGLKLLSFMSGRPIKGVLGMDCLRHYCIQLDFETGKIHFLEPDHLNVADLGKAYPLLISGPQGRPFIHHTGVLGGINTNTLIDTGFKIDGVVGKDAIKGRHTGNVLTCVRNFFVEKIAATFGGWFGAATVRMAARVPECVWDGATYTGLKVGVDKHSNLIGLRFLARHLVTLNFPKQTMYLRRTSAGPLVNENSRITAWPETRP